MTSFDQRLAAHRLTLNRSSVQTLQINVGRKCNQACRGCHVIERNNLTIKETPAFAWLPEYLAANEVEVVASLPCYTSEYVDAQRGDGVFDKNIRALKKLPWPRVHRQRRQQLHRRAQLSPNPALPLP